MTSYEPVYLGSLQQIGVALALDHQRVQCELVVDAIEELFADESVANQLRLMLVMPLAEIAIAQSWNSDRTDALERLERRLDQTDSDAMPLEQVGRINLMHAHVLMRLNRGGEALALYRRIAAHDLLDPEIRAAAGEIAGSSSYEARDWPGVIEALSAAYRIRRHGSDPFMLRAEQLERAQPHAATLPMLVEAHIAVGDPWAAVVALEQLRNVTLREGARGGTGSVDIADAVRDVTAERPLCYLLAGPNGGRALVVRHDLSTVSVEMPGFGLDDVLPRIDELIEFEDRLQGEAGDFDRFLGELTDWMWSAGIGALAKELVGERAASFVPVGPMSFLPMHGARRIDSTGRHRYLIDELLVSYVTSAQTAFATARRRTGRRYATALVVHSPRPTMLPDLPSAALEAESIAKHLETTGLPNELATRENVLREWGRHDVIHFACHARARMTQPLASGIFLAGDYELTINEILDRIGDVENDPLVVLSACESARGGSDRPDEPIALPSAFIELGASGVVGTMWSIWDDSAAAIVARLYQAIVSEELPVARALRWALRGVEGTPALDQWEAGGVSAPVHLLDWLPFIFFDG